MKRLVWLTACVHGYEGVCSFGDCPGGQTEIAEAVKEWRCLRGGDTRVCESWNLGNHKNCGFFWVVEAGK